MQPQTNRINHLTIIIMKRITSFLLLLMVFSVSLHAQKRYDEIKFPKLNKFEKSKVEKFQLDNGITFYLVEDRELPLITLSITAAGGSIQGDPSKSGLAGITGQVMREGGSTNYPGDDLNVLLEDKAANMSSFFGFSNSGASMGLLAEDFDELLPVFIDFIKNPLFPEDKIELAKTQTKSGISRRNDNQGGIGSREFSKLIYGEDTPYTTQTEYATIDNITRDDLVDLHKSTFVGNNMLIGVIGDFKTKDMKKKLEEAFGSIPAGQKTNILYPEVNYEYTSSINFVDKSDVNQSFVTLGHLGGLRKDPDFPALQVMNQVLSGGFSGRLFQVVRTDLGLAYSVGGSYNSNVFYPGQFTITTMTKSETTAAAIDAIIGELKRIQDEPITEEELTNTKDQFLNSLIFRYDTKGKILAEQINNQILGLDENEFDRFVEAVKKVSIADVQRVAKKHLQPNNLQILVVGNKEEIGDQLAKYGPINEIDVTIPTPQVETTTAGGDAVQGKAWLKKMAEAVVQPGTSFERINVEGNQSLGALNLGITGFFDYVNEGMSLEIQAPQGTINLDIADGKGTQKLGAQEAPLPPATVKQQLDGNIRSSYIYMALRADELEAEYLGDEEIDGKSYALLQVKGEVAYTFVLDKETALPIERRSEQFNPQLGSQVTVVSTFADWKVVGGVAYAYTETASINGQTAGGTKLTSHSVE